MVGWSVSGDIDRLAVAVGEWERGLSAEDLCAEWEASDAAFELVDDLEVAAGVGAWVAEGLPMSVVVNQQLDDTPLGGDRPEDPSAEHDRPRGACLARGDF